MLRKNVFCGDGLFCMLNGERGNIYPFRRSVFLPMETADRKWRKKWRAVQLKREPFAICWADFPGQHKIKEKRKTSNMQRLFPLENKSRLASSLSVRWGKRLISPNK